MTDTFTQKEHTMKKSMGLGLALLAVGGFVAFTYAQDHKDSYGKQDPHAGHDHSAQGDQEAGGEDAMMEAWAKASKPGPHHAHLKPLVGKWNATAKFRPSPEAPWMESRSTGEYAWTMGGRFITQKVFGEPMMPEMPSFEGFGIIGYDNVTEKYQSFWIDNYGTMMMMAEGTCDATGKTFTFKGTFTDPMTGKPTWLKSVYKIESNDRITLTMYGPDPTGQEFRTMEIIHTRAG